MGTWSGNKVELAEFFEVSTNTVDDWIRKGCPFVERGSAGVGWRFDFRQVRAWREQALVNQAVASKQDTSITESSRRRALAEAEMKEIELAEKRGKIASIDQVGTDMDRIFKNVSTRLDAIPIKAAPLLAACRNEVECQAVLRRVIDEARHELSELPFLPDESVSAVRQAAGAAAKADGKPVGRSVPDAQPGKQRRAGKVGHRKSRVPAGHA